MPLRLNLSGAVVAVQIGLHLLTTTSSPDEEMTAAAAKNQKVSYFRSYLCLLASMEIFLSINS
jgi:hypothetical protein